MLKMADMAKRSDTDLETDSLIGTSEAASRLDLVPSTISRMVKEGRMAPAMRLPGKTGAMLFTPAEIDRVAREMAEPTEVAS